MASEKNNVVMSNVVFIVMWIDWGSHGEIESVWTTEAAAKVALEAHARESGWPETSYRIVERKLGQTHWND